MTNFHRIAVIGATGTLGKPVVRALVNAGFSVTALVRDHRKAKIDLPEVVQFVSGDLYNFADVRKLLEGQDAIYINLNLNQGEKKNDLHTETDGLKIILDEAHRARVKRIAFVSSLVMRYQGMNDFNWWVFDLKREAVTMIQTCRIPYTIFYPSTFMENFEGNYRSGKAIMLAGKSKAKMWYIAGADFGKQVAKSFEVLQQENRDYIVQGPEAFTADEAAREYVSHYKKEKLKISKAPLFMLQFLGLFSQKINYGAHIVEALNNYPEKFESERTWKELGKPTIKLQEFAAGTN